MDHFLIASTLVNGNSSAARQSSNNSLIREGENSRRIGSISLNFIELGYGTCGLAIEETAENSFKSRRPPVQRD
jgi:hypothetical protein